MYIVILGEGACFTGQKLEEKESRDTIPASLGGYKPLLPGPLLSETPRGREQRHTVPCCCQALEFAVRTKDSRTGAMSPFSER